MIKRKKAERKQHDDDDDNGFGPWGGYMAAKISKLEDQFTNAANKCKNEQLSNIFCGVSIFVNGYTVPPADELKRIMITHGGVYNHYETNNTTHIIASNLPDCKVKRLKEMNIVKPSWIVDSVAAGLLLDFRDYLLYSNCTKSQPRLCFKSNEDSKLTKSVHADNKNTSVLQNARNKTLNKQVEHNNAADEKPVEKINTQLSENEPQAKNEKKEISREEKVEDTVTVGAKANIQNIHEKEINSKLVDGTFNKKGPVRTAVEPQFLSDFYNNSRLHHLSTMGAMFKDYILKLREESTGIFSGIERLLEWKKREKNNAQENHNDDLVDDFMEDGFDNIHSKSQKVIMHIDMDCFFVSVGLRKRPDLRGFPIAVTHAKAGSTSHSGGDRNFEKNFYQQRFENRLKQKQGGADSKFEVERKSRLTDVNDRDSLSEIASCNYEARKAGVKNGMFFGTAVKLCPNLKTIPYDFEGYKEVSFKLYDILASYTLEIEAVSCDEMYVDCSNILKKANVSPLEFASFLRDEIFESSGCTASAGIGANPLQARLATKKAKPNGQYYLLPSDVERFMYDIKVEDLPGVGYSLAYRLQNEGIVTCRDLQKISLNGLQRKFGMKTGETLYKHARGEDNRALDICHQRKSVSAEVNYGIRFTMQSEAENFLKQLAEEVESRLKQAKARGRQITLKLLVRAKDAPVETAKYMGHGACDQITRSVSLASVTDDANIIFREIVNLERQLKITPSDLRGIGIQVTRLNMTGNGAKSTVLTDFLGLTKTSDLKKNVEKSPILNKMKKDQCVTNQLPHKDVKNSTSNNVDDSNFGKRIPEIAAMTLHQDNKQIVHKTAEKAKEDLSLGSEKRSSSLLCNNQQANTSKSQVVVPMMTISQARKLVRAWVTSEEEPQKYDIRLLSTYMQQLVEAHRLIDLDILCSLLHRCISTKGSKWKNAYRNIIGKMQEAMKKEYNAELHCLEEF